MQRTSRLSSRTSRSTPAQSIYTRVSTRDTAFPDELYRKSQQGRVTRFHEQRHHQQQQQLQRSEGVGDIADTPDRPDNNTLPQAPEKPLSLIDRIRVEKNRAVQRWLVALRLAEAPPRDLVFKQQKKDFADAIEALRDTKRDILRLTDQVLGTTTWCWWWAFLSLCYPLTDCL